MIGSISSTTEGCKPSVGSSINSIEDLAQLIHDLKNANPLARKEDRAAIRRLQPVDTAEQSRLPAAGRTENANGLALRHRKVDALQCLMVFEGFAQSGDLKDGNRAHASAACLTSPSRY